LRCSLVVRGLADYFVGLLDLRAEGVGEAFLDEADGEVGNVDADPAAVETLRDLDGGAAAAEGIVILSGVEGRVEIDKIDGLILDVALEDFEVVRNRADFSEGSQD
jgi:hypothetical protein